MTKITYNTVKNYLQQQKTIQNQQNQSLDDFLKMVQTQYNDLGQLIGERKERTFIQEQQYFPNIQIQKQSNSYNYLNSSQQLSGNKYNQPGLRKCSRSYNQNNQYQSSSFRKNSSNFSNNNSNYNSNRKLSEFQKSKDSEEVVQLKKKIEESENNYLEHQNTKSQEQKFVSDIRFKLNTLSPDNLATKKIEIIDLLKQITYQELQELIAEQLVKKAIDDIKYQQTFAQLFSYIFGNNSLIKKLMLKQLEKLFRKQKPLIPLKKEFKTLESQEKSEYLEKRRKKFFQLGVLLGNLYRFDVLPRREFYGYLFRALQKMCGQYDMFLHLKKQNKEEDQEDDYNYLEYLEIIISILDKAGQRMDEQHANKLKTSFYNDKLKTEHFQILELQDYLIETRETMGDCSVMVEELEIFKLNELKFISIDGYFDILKICCNLSENRNNNNNDDDDSNNRIDNSQHKNIIDKLKIIAKNNKDKEESFYEDSSHSSVDNENHNEFKEQTQEIADIRLQILIENIVEKRSQGWEEGLGAKQNTAITKQQIKDEVELQNKLKQQRYEKMAQIEMEIKKKYNNKDTKYYVNEDYDEDDFDEEDDEEGEDSQNNEIEKKIDFAKPLQNLTREMRED